MRVSVPTIPEALLRTATATQTISHAGAVERISSFIAPGNVAVLTGAGVSVDSGIRAYRGVKGRYLNPNYKPIFYHELMDSTEKGAAFRRRYWYQIFRSNDVGFSNICTRLRSYIGYPPLSAAQPNPTHYALAALQYSDVVNRLVTQNVDGLHHKAISHVWDNARMEERILELHGRLRSVRCSNGHLVQRDAFQERLSEANPQWKAFMGELEATGRKVRTNPDGDVELEGVSYDEFVVPDCPACLSEGLRNNILKPEVIFFGESISKEVKGRSFADVESCDRLFMVGTTLATFSAFRLLKHALDLRKPVLLLNLGPTRADALAHPIEKIEMSSGTVMADVAKAVLGSRASEDPVVVNMLRSGIVRPPLEDEDDTAPRAVG
ncbi:DHS-like NAD/FAD-binding domain-containing protein [Laetiporus sulphureus 93-53]|uniref:DHS-like NAD/FAD-binding domain-containing protein n=1 Tax=Laetiporus sulphureus 93-53 TaxID=1314785 RepID=A0A165EL92_9APHY|nr:DHS-like NAD/FAD-binding domain-containing protein [Laetiporus sulphureus 93-53]KZT07293.1 DHS-like NAD/FAD-binding domain-containing protein [Laetiporus sulphureus 93-53]